MTNLRKKTLAIILTLASPVLVPLLLLLGSACMAGMYWIMGYYVNVPGWKMGEIAAAKGNVEECELLRKTWYFGGFDSGDMHRSECIHTYAQLTQDPSACGLLMPSEYGLSCINDVIAQEYKGHMDSGFFEWDECSKPQSDSLKLDWCDLLRAHRNRSAADCLPIRNDIIRQGCTLKFEAWEKYPELRGSFSFGKAAS